MDNGQVWSYFDTATRAASTEIMGSIGTIQLPWQPAHGQLIVHGAEIIRGADHIDLLGNGKPFSILRREQQMDRRILDGMLTATMPVEGLRVGDIVHLTFSVTLKDPTLGGNMQTAAALMFDPFRTQFARTRFLWPEETHIAWKAHAEGLAPKPVITGGFSELSFTMPLAKQREIPGDAPLRFQHLPIIEASSFRNWAEVAAVMAPLYETDGLIQPDGTIAKEVARIMAAESDPLKRAALALQLVQEKIRYQLMGMDAGNYVPQTPVQTWDLRYGDCKAKTLLLLAMLKLMDIDAEPVLANITLGGLVPDRLPSAAAFDHVLVRATIGSDTLWLDGTGSGSRLGDIHDTPNFGYVLPVRAQGADLIRIVPRADARAMVTARIAFDASAGINLPTPFRMIATVRGATTGMLRAMSAQGSKEDLEQGLSKIVTGFIPDATIGMQQLKFDDAGGTATVEATGLAYLDWKKDSDRLKSALDTVTPGIAFAPDRARPAWREIPVSVGSTSTSDIQTEIRLPGQAAGFAIEGDQALQGVFAGVSVDRKAHLANGIVMTDIRVRSMPAEIAASAIPEERKRIAAVQGRQLSIVAPADYPPLWDEVAQAKRANRLAPIIAIFTKRIADKPENSSHYTDRAWFFDRVFERKQAIADLTRALDIDPTVATYLQRSGIYFDLGENAKAMADAKTAYAIDPASTEAISRLATIQAEQGDRAGAIALLQERIDIGGKSEVGLLLAKAQIEADGGNTEAALATIDAAIVQMPGNAVLLNGRCWLKGTRKMALDTALKDCTKAIELSDEPTQPLDSRAMVYYRLERYEDALADLEAALQIDPNLSSSLFLRGIIRKHLGQAGLSQSDMLAARTTYPRVDRDYEKYGIAF
ncbi:DUF3857 domain-containing protein [Sphingobium boeckii]|uniref:Tetratricopeptide (TPR) repeat protein/transglutaminase-like putative cysteine protease n=1 Tax=Sphingobium boeckii TaxID=1082345 RepID=A0A7W9AHN2_9SPHN|nr:DUF3857 domain-containing protein [Sphingobium boeckii]MBB5685867.1 tetratricopeptide (TPR) repeat protein/transglutaminase-like putative cysteine protease [Sphingobium boeckii]